ncbi:hypothetical protein J6590_023980 [Homalodisca vitripennis]|nr:hypothetical protein J6590_023980 [Homalodisca vitripennis]
MTVESLGRLMIIYSCHNFHMESSDNCVLAGGEEDSGGGGWELFMMISSCYNFRVECSDPCVLAGDEEDVRGVSGSRKVQNQVLFLPKKSAMTVVTPDSYFGKRVDRKDPTSVSVSLTLSLRQHMSVPSYFRVLSPVIISAVDKTTHSTANFMSSSPVIAMCPTASIKPLVYSGTILSQV